jgi:hypothetical protein
MEKDNTTSALTQFIKKRNIPGVEVIKNVLTFKHFFTHDHL